MRDSSTCSGCCAASIRSASTSPRWTFVNTRTCCTRSSLEALERCGATMQELLADPLYRRHLEAHGRQQCVLIGYSDSNKEGGACASRFAIHQAQGALAQVLAACGERPIIFHARGGSIPRGGGRIDTLVRAAPA